MELDKSQVTHISLNVSHRKSVTNLPTVSDDKLSGSYSSAKRLSNNDLTYSSISNFKNSPEPTRSCNALMTKFTIKDSGLNEILESAGEYFKPRKLSELKMSTKDIESPTRRKI